MFNIMPFANFLGGKMRKTDLTKFKKLFIAQREHILFNTRVIDENFYVRPDEDKDEVDQATKDIEQSVRLQLKNREVMTLKKINEALRRIDEGTYDECESCGATIELKRLQARPTTTLCLGCKEEQERAEGTTVLGRRGERVH